jgi:hypothetical protein
MKIKFNFKFSIFAVLFFIQYQRILLAADSVPSESRNILTDQIEEEDTIEQTSSFINYVPMPNPTIPRQVHLSIEGASNLNSTLHFIGNFMTEFLNRMSRRKVKVVATVDPLSSGNNGPNNMRLKLIPGANSHVPIIGNAVSAKHENGHEFGLGHASTQIWANQTTIQSYSHERDGFDPMTIAPGVPSYNAPHLHFLGWFGGTEEAFLEPGNEYVLRVINDGNKDFTSLKALYYEVPGSNRVYWFSYVRVAGTHWNTPAGMPGTAIAIHSSPNKGADTNLEDIFGVNSRTLIRSGLIFHLSEITSTTVKVNVTVDPNWVLIGK